ncbi:MAG TPA: hypothetical protein VLU94_02570 [Candidatus Nitrosotalea sp.]|nr:hypothetical protein [Candidatus Nitrosotalea sp.]
MKFRATAFNTYLILPALLLASGCKSPEQKKHDKTLATFRVFLEAPADSRPPPQSLQGVLGGNAVVEIAGASIVVNNTPLLDESMVEKAMIMETQDGGFALQIILDSHGKLMLESVTTANPNRHLGILSRWGVDKQVTQRWLAAPMISAPISEGVLIFTPNTTREEADQIVLGLSNVVKKRKKESALFDLGTGS